MKLTDQAVKRIKPDATAQKLSDGGGLFVLVTAQGSKLWRLAYRFGGKQKTLALGKYPEVTLAMARERREEARRLLATGVDPSELKKASKTQQATRSANSFEAVAREWFAKHATGWADTHSSKIMGRLDRDVFPWLGGKPIAEIGAPDVLTVLRRIEARGVVETAHRVAMHIGHRVHVFPGGRDPKRAMSEAAINAALRRLGVDTKTQMTGHGFRATARTLLHEVLNFAPEVIEHQLAHRVPDALGAAYNRTKFLPERVRMMTTWADYLEGLKVGVNAQ